MIDLTQYEAAVAAGRAQHWTVESLTEMERGLMVQLEAVRCALEGLRRAQTDDRLHGNYRYCSTIEWIKRSICVKFNLPPDAMTTPRRHQSIALPRQIAMFLCRKLTRASLNEIGSAFGGRDHGTVLSAVKSVQARMDTDPEMARIINRFLTEMPKTINAVAEPC